MTSNRQIGLAVGGSVIGHLALAGAATAIMALKLASPPANDDFADAARLRPELEVSAFGDNLYAMREAGEPPHGGTVAGGSVWWRWTAPESARVELEVACAGFREVVAVYRGALIGTLVEVVERRAGESEPLWFVAEEATTYYIAVAGAGDVEAGAIELNIFARSEVQQQDQLALLLPEMFELEELELPADDDRGYLRTEGMEPAAAAPERPQFESDRNTLAASELPPSEEGDKRAPTQDGKDWPFADLAERDYVDGEFGEPSAAAEPAAAAAAASSREVAATEAEAEAAPPTETLPSPFRTPGAEAPEDWRGASEEDAAVIAERQDESVLDEIVEDANADLEAAEVAPESVDSESEEAPPEFIPLADFESRPEVEETPQQPEGSAEKSPQKASGVQPPPIFRPHTVKKRSLGTLSNIGKSALDAAQTPLGRYKKEVDQAVQRSWNRARRARADFATYGSLKVRFWIDRRGRVVDVRVLKQDATPVMVDFSLVGIRGAKIPPMPEELFELTEDGKIDFDYNIIIY